MKIIRSVYIYIYIVSNQDQIKISLSVKIEVALNFMCMITKYLHLKYSPFDDV